MDNAMYQTLQKIDIISDQTDEKLQTIQQHSIIQSISDDSFKEAQERVQRVETAVNQLIANNTITIKKNKD